MLDTTSQLNTSDACSGNEASCAIADRSSGDRKAKESPGPDHIPNELVRALHGMCRFVATCGSDPGQRIGRLRDEWNKMSPSSRESTRQLLDFMLPVLVPLREGMPGKKRKL